MDRRLFVRLGLMAAAAPLFPKSLLASSVSDRLNVLSEEPLRRIAFGSCNDQTKNQSHWSWIARENPQLWIWLGDNIYADRATLDQRRDRYQSLKNNPDYKKFIDQVPVIGTWDDHDYYNENADGSYADKDGSKELMLEFMDTAWDHPVWARPGVFQSYGFGPVGQRTQIILLDLRYFQDRNKNQKSLLGELQWQFLEDEIRSSTADLILIGSSLNVCSPVVFASLEGWQAFPAEKQRLYNLLASIDKPCVLMSGDRHMGELYRIILPNGKPVYEVMASGLTHAIGIKLPSKERQGEPVGRKHFGLINIDWTSSGPDVQLRLQSAERSEVYHSLATNFAF
ncbi:MAG TPA: alkaline phosphatase D family protein [Oligoflexus sp.]|uniref:alkaline phosphatase D family protein n=1 Tax=Oligoflexus sp. TaxID=1971216 RepID=UPI002D760E78|nr:alkaline phosphatase D family protein [Oligoflexus sp.]HYX32358.1 alkaline phosphatase D family protein [Oligoflexus sp.]